MPGPVTSATAKPVVIDRESKKAAVNREATALRERAQHAVAAATQLHTRARELYGKAAAQRELAASTTSPCLRRQSLTNAECYVTAAEQAQSASERRAVDAERLSEKARALEATKH